MLPVFKSETWSRSRVFEWCARFRSGRQSVSDDDRALAPHFAVTTINIACVFGLSGRYSCRRCAFWIYSECRLLQYTTLRAVTWPAIRQKWLNLWRKDIILQHDNAPPQKARQTVEKVAMMRWELLPHPPCSQDLAPSDFQPFRPLTVSLGWLKFEDDQQHVLKFFLTADKDFYATSFRRLVEHWQR